ncbi:hypothetical protein [Tepidiforma sp.]|uniref:hypothetical protein n=1 Tax=Tepidiforma sp. TaxID=2682230 RepID=UPI002ADDC68F|nr:hypothetical protein [Tepidiforma sp.]
MDTIHRDWLKQRSPSMEAPALGRYRWQVPVARFRDAGDARGCLILIRELYDRVCPA